MRLELSPRANITPLMRLAAPIAALVLAFAIAAIVIAFYGKSPLQAFDVYIVGSLSDSWALQELLVKATPLILIAIGLSYCFRSNLWNIGAEGQFVIGGLFGGWIAIATHGGEWSLVWPYVLLVGAVAGAVYGFIPAILKVRFGANEILTSLMLVNIAQLFLDYMVRGPLKDPKGMNFPQSVTFEDAALLPKVFGSDRVHFGLILAIIVVLITMVIVSRSIFGYRLRITGDAPKAASFAGFSSKTTTIIVFCISGALAGLAGASEVAGQIGQLQPTISPGYGFSAVTVAFLGRLHPVGIVLSALVLAMVMIGGENAQIMLKLPLDLTTAFQGLLLLIVLSADALVSYKFRIVRGRRG
ncbi:ABC transporter permease [Microvirga sp. W0021]|uniref:ABC transporter permease n=1 Tax=Hohaiivirga grylli TaxID=3133970 RepID=A0ABV0BJJ7_9HYPH